MCTLLINQLYVFKNRVFIHFITEPINGVIQTCQAITMTDTNAMSERTFRALAYIKTYMRTTMGQQQLNHLMIIFVYKDRLDYLDMETRCE